MRLPSLVFLQHAPAPSPPPRARQGELMRGFSARLQTRARAGRTSADLRCQWLAEAAGRAHAGKHSEPVALAPGALHPGPLAGSAGGDDVQEDEGLKGSPKNSLENSRVGSKISKTAHFWLAPLHNCLAHPTRAGPAGRLGRSPMVARIIGQPSRPDCAPTPSRGRFVSRTLPGRARRAGSV